MIQKELKNGAVFTYQNEEQTLEATVEYSRTLGGGNAFKIFFNGAFVSITKTFNPCRNKIMQLCKKYGLSLCIKPVCQSGIDTDTRPDTMIFDDIEQ